MEVDIDDEFALLEEAIADDEVESASKHRQSIFWSPSTITVITREDILASGATTFGDMRAEAGLTVRAPLGEPFREWAGIARPPGLIFDNDSDFGGERVARLVALYLRGSF